MSINFEKASQRIADMLTEQDVNIMHGNYETASWSPAERMLRLPYFAGNINEDGYLTMLVHEIGHAIHTPTDGWKAHASNDKRARYLNIIEDIRIERLMKQDYPGMTSTFMQGYYNLYHDCDIFSGIDESTVGLLSFIDRLNVDAKIGHIINVNFTEAESEVRDNAYNADTFDDVTAIVDGLLGSESKDTADAEKALTDFAEFDWEDETLQNLKETLGKYFTEDGEIDYDALVSDSSGFVEQVALFAGEIGFSDRSHNVEAEFEDSNIDSKPLTDKQRLILKLQAAVQVLLSGNSDLVYRGAVSSIVESTTVTSITNDNHESCARARARAYLSRRKVDHNSTDNYRTLYTSYSAVINKMAADFNRRKMAIQRLNSTQHKTGNIDPSKLHAAKLREDIFTNDSKQPKGISHAGVFYVDHSGSMSGPRLRAVYIQAFIMSEFCRRVKIPFKTVGWTSGNIRGYSTTNSPTNIMASARLATIVDSSMSSFDYYQRMEALSHFVLNAGDSSPFMELDGTPGMSAKIALLEDVADMKEKLGIQKVHAMFLTDGGYYRGSIFSKGASLTFRGRNITSTDDNVDHNMMIDNAILQYVDSYIGFYVGLGTSSTIKQQTDYEQYHNFFTVPTSVVSTLANVDFENKADAETVKVVSELCDSVVSRFA